MTRFQSWVLGYPDQLSVRPGDTVSFHVSGDGADTFDAQLVRLIHGDTQPAGPGFKEIEVPSAVDGTYPLLTQRTHHGSYARIPDAGRLLGRRDQTLSLFAIVQPLIETGPQPLITVWDEAANVGSRWFWSRGCAWPCGSGALRGSTESRSRTACSRACGMRCAAPGIRCRARSPSARCRSSTPTTPASAR